MEDILKYVGDSFKESLNHVKGKFSEGYGNLGFWGNPFKGSDTPLMANFDSLYIGREEQIKEVSLGISNSLSGEGQDTIIIGCYGVGCRSFVNLFKNYLRSLEGKELEAPFDLIPDKLAKIIDVPVCNLHPGFREEVRAEILDYLKNNQTVLITSYFCDKHLPYLSRKNKFKESTLETYRKVLELDDLSSDKVIFLSPWPANAWNFAKDDAMVKRVYESIIILKPLEEQEIVNLLIRRIQFYSSEQKNYKGIFSQDVLKEIAKYSGGIPRFALEHASKYLEHNLNQKKMDLGKEGVRKILKDRSYEKIKSKLHEVLPPLSDFEKRHNKEKIKTKIFKALIGLGGENVTATQISNLEMINKSRPAVSRNMLLLEKMGLLDVAGEERVHDSRKRPYEIDPFVRSVFENEFIIPEIEQNSNH